MHLRYKHERIELKMSGKEKTVQDFENKFSSKTPLYITIPDMLCCPKYTAIYNSPWAGTAMCIYGERGEGEWLLWVIESFMKVIKLLFVISV